MHIFTYMPFSICGIDISVLAKLQFHIKAMAQQLNLTEQEFLGIHKCTLDKEDFIRIQK